jgi:hypothetical protein
VNSLPNDFLSLKNNVNVASRTNKQKTLREQKFSVAILIP